MPVEGSGGEKGTRTRARARLNSSRISEGPQPSSDWDKSAIGSQAQASHTIRETKWLKGRSALRNLER